MASGKGLSPEQLSSLSLGMDAMTTLGSGIAGYRLGQAKASYQKTAGKLNADFIRLQAGGVREQGAREAAMLATKGRMTKGSQRAALAAQGVDVNVGSAQDIQDSTELQYALDVNTIRNNAWLQAWGLESQASQVEAGAEFDSSLSSAAATGTLLTSGLQALSGGMKAYGVWEKSPRVAMTEREKAQAGATARAGR